MLNIYTELQWRGQYPRYFGFIGPRGRTLNPGDSYNIVGDLATMVLTNHPDGRAGAMRELESLEAMMDTGDLVVRRGPDHVVQSPDGDTVGVLGINNGGSFALTDPYAFSSASA